MKGFSGNVRMTLLDKKSILSIKIQKFKSQHKIRKEFLHAIYAVRLLSLDHIYLFDRGLKNGLIVVFLVLVVLVVGKLF